MPISAATIPEIISSGALSATPSHFPGAAGGPKMSASTRASGQDTALFIYGGRRAPT